ncbi:hypothetical protein J4558_06790 [Leptolyngbya sp. 15MV]|nr:hypothetical protein J4558_06790 [Leptolyngbya sp. 15MV]
MTNSQPRGLAQGRFAKDTDPLFREINDSLPFDYRLLREDIRGSIAWARAIERAGVLTAAERDRLTTALEALDAHAASHPRAPLDDLARGERHEDVHSWVEARLIAAVPREHDVGGLVRRRCVLGETVALQHPALVPQTIVLRPLSSVRYGRSIGVDRDGPGRVTRSQRIETPPPGDGGRAAEVLTQGHGVAAMHLPQHRGDVPRRLDADLVKVERVQHGWTRAKREEVGGLIHACAGSGRCGPAWTPCRAARACPQDPG